MMKIQENNSLIILLYPKIHFTSFLDLTFGTTSQSKLYNKALLFFDYSMNIAFAIKIV